MLNTLSILVDLLSEQLGFAGLANTSTLSTTTYTRLTPPATQPESARLHDSQYIMHMPVQVSAYICCVVRVACHAKTDVHHSTNSIKAAPFALGAERGTYFISTCRASELLSKAINCSCTCKATTEVDSTEVLRCCAADQTPAQPFIQTAMSSHILPQLAVIYCRIGILAMAGFMHSMQSCCTQDLSAHTPWHG